MAAEPQFDAEAIGMLRRVGRNALAVKMIALFLGSVDERRDAILSATSTGDLPSAQRAAHMLKASAGQMGARSLQRLCEDIEHAAKDGRAPELAALSVELPGECDAAATWLRSMNASLTSPAE